jgi:hypothetical protein
LFDKKRILTLLFLAATLQILRHLAFRSTRSAGEPLDVNTLVGDILKEAQERWRENETLVTPRAALLLVLADLDYSQPVIIGIADQLEDKLNEMVCAEGVDLDVAMTMRRQNSLRAA